MNGYDVQIYLSSKEKAKYLLLTIVIEGDVFCLYNTKDLLLGKFTDTRHLFNYLCGYESGYNKGFTDKEI